MRIALRKPPRGSKHPVLDMDMVVSYNKKAYRVKNTPLYEIILSYNQGALMTTTKIGVGRLFLNSIRRALKKALWVVFLTAAAGTAAVLGIAILIAQIAS